MDLRRNLQAVLDRIAAAAGRSGRPAQAVTLVAVTKTVEPAVMADLHRAGQAVFGENRPQALRDKSKALAPLPIRWHMIGTLQSNKIKYVYPLVEMIHSVDRRDLLEEFPRWAEKTGRVCPCLLEVHISDEETKQGLAPEEVLGVIEACRERPGLDIRGLMGMAPFVDDPAVVRGAFRKLAGLFQASRALEGPSYHARELSMGMSDDFEIAIEEGATIVRVGRALFAE